MGSKLESSTHIYQDLSLEKTISASNQINIKKWLLLRKILEVTDTFSIDHMRTRYRNKKGVAGGKNGGMPFEVIQYLSIE